MQLIGYLLMCKQEWCIVMSARTNTIFIKQKWINWASYVWKWIIVSLVVASELSNHCYLWFIVPNGITSNVNLSLYCNAY